MIFYVRSAVVKVYLTLKVTQIFKEGGCEGLNSLINRSKPLIFITWCTDFFYFLLWQKNNPTVISASHTKITVGSNSKV